MTDDEKKALETLQKIISQSAKKKVEDTDVYQKVENKVEEIVKKHPLLAGTAQALIEGELGGSIDIGEDKTVGFAYNPEENSGSLRFKMDFEDGGFVNKYAPGDTVYPDEIKNLTVWDAINQRIANLTNEYNAGQISRSSLDEAVLTKSRLFGLTQNKVQYTNLMELTFNKKAKEVLLVDFNTPTAQKNLYKTALEQGKGNGKHWFKGQPGAAVHFKKGISGMIGNQNLGYNAAASIKDTDPILTQGKIVGAGSRGPVIDEKVYQQVVKAIENIKDPGAKNLAKLMLVTGIRRDDLVRLTAADINLEAKTITPTSFKGAPSRTIPLSDTAVSLLRNQMNINQYEQIFYKPGIKPEGLGGSYGKFINQAFTNIKIYDNVQKVSRKFTLEDLRRSFMSRADALGVPEDVIDRFVGHTTKGTKRKYTKGKTTTALGLDESILKYVNNLEADLYGQLKLSSQEAINTFSGGQRTAPQTLGQQVEEITQPKIQSQSSTQERIPVPQDTKKRIKVPEEVEIKSTKSVSGKPYEALPKPNQNKVKLALDKAGKTTKLASILSIIAHKAGKAAGLIIPAENIQAINQAYGGEEGILPTTESGNILGFIPPTTAKEAEGWSELLNIPTYPKGHPKEGQHIHSIKDYKELNQPDTEQFEQESRL